jgi:biotin-(acetyl-CoA carboxylase) ligase
MMGSPLLVVDHTGSWQGVATGVRRDGGLLVRDRSGVIRTVYAADVSIRKPDSSAQEALQVRKGIVK